MDGYHPPVEEYLETVHALKEEGTPVIQARIAERLGRTAPSVSEMLDRLEDDGYITRSGRLVELTDSGSKVATSVVRRHRLAERLLADVIGLEWYKVHSEAGRWEHVISEDVEAKLVALLGDPATCPHGNPIPGSGHAAPSGPAVALTDAEPGQHVVLRRISEELELDVASLRFLDDNAFLPGSHAAVERRGADGTVVVELDGRELAVSAPLASRLYVAVE